MAIENVGATVPGAEAAADLSAKQHYLMKMTSTGVNVCGDGELPLGVLQNKPSALGRAATVWGVGSVSKVVASAAIAKGAKVASTATGTAVTAASGDYIAGYALDAVTASGDLVSVFISNPGRLA